ncbi:peptidoglycan DD-metalloendopeptidase family protein [Microbacterium sp. SSW1-49]|uniref:Peptidoglycan DD-metalloendopeptidase family protein n=1 Tax=Microbacterium croceum TaxID=2851645 RepID=A0ABT0FCT1_9MICO|nr:peptidoglycan DD-metalloendopeptidase family protein [Microbacterium croceum]
MPFENSPADAAPTRRSSRLRTAAFEAPAAGTTDSASIDSAVARATATPLSRRAVRARMTAETPVADTADEAVSIPTPAELLDESVETPSIPFVAAPAAAAEADAHADAFELASRAFRAVTGPVALQQTSAPNGSDDEGTESVAAPDAHVAPRRPRNARKFLALGATVGVMSLAGLLAVSMTLPAEAVAAAQGTSVASTSLVAGSAAAKGAAGDDEIQAFIASSDVQSESLARDDDFSTISLVDVAAEQGINYSSEIFTNDPDAAIQWPFMVGVGMSYGYGMRSGRLHEGIDFVPGDGAPVQAIADGTVRIATEQGGAYGVTVYIDHVIDGSVITSHYSHMQYGSLRVKAGDKVTVGTVVGKTGNTGRSYGAHMHFELIVNGTTIDPLPWLRENAGRYSY